MPAKKKKKAGKKIDPTTQSKVVLIMVGRAYSDGESFVAEFAIGNSRWGDYKTEEDAQAAAAQAMMEHREVGDLVYLLRVVLPVVPDPAPVEPIPVPLPTPEKKKEQPAPDVSVVK